MRGFLIRFVGLWLCFVAVACYAQNFQTLPSIAGESLSGHKVVFPEATSGKVAILIFGFTKASKTPCGAWGDKLSAEYSKNNRVEIYQLPVLEDVPRFVRGMVISGIRKGTPESKRDHFVPILHDEAMLKKLVTYKEQDDAYLVLIDPNGQVVEQLHGSPNDALYSRMKAAGDELLRR